MLEKDVRKYKQGKVGGVNDCSTHKKKMLIPVMKSFLLIRRQ